jgi:hypothetical protein
VLNDLPRDARHLYWTPCKNVVVASEEVDELAFLFGVSADPDLDCLDRVLGVDLHGLGILGRLEGAG